MSAWLENVLLQVDAAAGNGDSNACIELVNLLRDAHPLSALSFGRKAKRLGIDIELEPLQTVVERMRPSELPLDPLGCYRLGTEVSSYPVSKDETRKAITYLKVAAEAPDFVFSGAAALCLADLLSSLGSSESYKYYSLAEAQGFCDILPPARSGKKEQASE